MFNLNSRLLKTSLWMSFTLCAIMATNRANAQLDFELPPVNYSKSQPDNCVSRLIEKLEDKNVKLEHDEKNGFLKSLLKELDIPIESQTLVFSKTSRQRTRISPQAPRAVYFNDDVYVGWVNDGKAIEISAADPRLGAVFYSLEPKRTDDQELPLKPEPVFTRQFGQCMICHTSTRTARIPGHIVRSVHADKTGMPITGSFTYNTSDQSPFKERWGGWYVTGTHGDQQHMGNVWAENKNAWRESDFAKGSNIEDLSDRIDVEYYLSPHSDIVALMVLEHQTGMHNAFTSANIDWQLYWQQAQEINRDNDQPVDLMTPESKEHLRAIAQQVADRLLLKGETRLAARVKGTSEFEKVFAKRGVTDKQGRNLRQFDLEQRLFKYPCSYMIESEAFDALPEALRESVLKIIWTTLNTESLAEEYGLTPGQCDSIVEIIAATTVDLPKAWRRKPTAHK